jgi:hypothetical protein
MAGSYSSSFPLAFDMAWRRNSIVTPALRSWDNPQVARIWQLSHAGPRVSNNGKLCHIHSALQASSAAAVSSHEVAGFIDGQPMSNMRSEQQPRLFHVESGSVTRPS